MTVDSNGHDPAQPAQRERPQWRDTVMRAKNPAPVRVWLMFSVMQTWTELNYIEQRVWNIGDQVRYRMSETESPIVTVHARDYDKQTGRMVYELRDANGRPFTDIQGALLAHPRQDEVGAVGAEEQEVRTREAEARAREEGARIRREEARAREEEARVLQEKAQEEHERAQERWWRRLLHRPAGTGQKRH